MLHNIRWRIAVPSIILIFLTMLGVGTYLSNLLRQIYLGELESQLANTARLVADDLAIAYWASNSTELLEQAAIKWGDLGALGSR